jgi:hypothetical protein
MSFQNWPGLCRRRVGYVAPVAIGLSLLMGLGGCSKSSFDLAPAGGVVTVDGVPFTTGNVMFAPIATGDDSRAGRPAMGRLQSDGSFVLSTYEEGDGAVVGEHWVHIIRIDDESGAASTVPPFRRLLVPERKAVVAGQDNQFDIKLTKDQILRFAEKGD